MFTGIIQELGTVKQIKRIGSIHRLSVIAKDTSPDAKIGDSIAVNGVCLTVVSITVPEITFEIMDESLKRTNLGKLEASDFVNMEPSLKLLDKLGGHMVNGHIDGTARLQGISACGQTRRFQIELPSGFSRFVVPKGSIAIDGASLTVGEVEPGWFTVYIIPHTLKSTNLAFAKIGDLVNIELDLMAKYVQKASSGDNVITEGYLREKGFI